MNSKSKIHSLWDGAFLQYGRVVGGYDLVPLTAVMEKTPLPKEGTVYVASEPELEKLDIFKSLEDHEFGGLPIQLGYCSGHNLKLNALEYHRSSEVNIAVTDLILLLGSLQDIDPDTFCYDTSQIEAFLVPANTMVELYAIALHYAPCQSSGEGFRAVVALPRDTNLPLTGKKSAYPEDRLLFAKNKWLIAHPESGLGTEGAFTGLLGENISL